ncbi:hypothetical protein RE9425_42860 [Prescottella equi]|uniref:hypothetical protein n=1 Tax=Rhodococcus hoagii TaxID=43767 RepID=UPI0011A66AE6|nr:hypothetical protein [Prescottella equi]BCN55896.1 hypothetical protein RE9425_42860 [Prescottella equi]
MGDGYGADEFEAFTRSVGDVVGVPTRVLDELSSPIGIQVLGRAGVGRSTLVSLLERSGCTNVAEAPAVDTPGRPDPDIGPDVVVHVFTGALRTPDMRVLTNAPRGSTVAVLAKADALGSWDDAVRAAATAAAVTGVRVIPTSASADAGALVTAVEDCVRVVRARRVRETLDALAAAAARDVDGPTRDGIEDFLRSDPAVFAAAEAVAVLGGDRAGDRRRQEQAQRRARTRRAVATGTRR